MKITKRSWFEFFSCEHVRRFSPSWNDSPTLDDNNDKNERRDELFFLPPKQRKKNTEKFRLFLSANWNDRKDNATIVSFSVAKGPPPMKTPNDTFPWHLTFSAVISNAPDVFYRRMCARAMLIHVRDKITLSSSLCRQRWHFSLK